MYSPTSTAVFACKMRAKAHTPQGHICCWLSLLCAMPHDSKVPEYGMLKKLSKLPPDTTWSNLFTNTLTACNYKKALE